MGIFDTVDEGAPTEEEDDSDASVSYIYVYEPGREDLEKYDSWAEDAYQMASGGGIVRRFAKSGGSAFRDIHELMSHIIVGLGKTIEDDGDFSHLLAVLEPDAESLARHLDQNPEVRDEVADLLNTTQTAEADD